jgi:hypothetical protein
MVTMVTLMAKAEFFALRFAEEKNAEIERLRLANEVVNEMAAQIQRLREALNVASANIVNMRIGLMSGGTKAKACNAMDLAHFNIQKELEVKP